MCRSDQWALNEDDLVRPEVEGLVDGEKIKIGPVVDLTEEESFNFHVPIPPLKCSTVEMLAEGIRIKDTGEEVWRAVMGNRFIEVGPVTLELRELEARGLTRDEAVGNLSKLVGQAVAQVYMGLMCSDDPAQAAAAKAMEADSDQGSETNP